MGQIILSAFSDEFATDFEEQLKGMRDFGIKNIEMRFVNGKNVADLSEAEVNIAFELLSKYGISVLSIGSPIGKIRLDEDFGEHYRKAENVFKTANILGAKYIRIFSFYAPQGKNIADYKKEVLERLSELINLAEKNNVILCHENEANIYGDTPERCLELLDYFGGKLKCVFDMGNFVLESVEPFSAYETLSKHIAYFHIKDALYKGAVVPPGKGEAKIKEIITAYKIYSQSDFLVTLEPHLQTFSGLNALVGKDFDNPYKYEDEKTAFTDAVNKLKELIL